MGWPKVAWNPFASCGQVRKHHRGCVEVRPQLWHGVGQAHSSDQHDPPEPLPGACPSRGQGSIPPSTTEPTTWNRKATAPLTAVPAAASGTFNPLCKVLCILQSLYLCAIGLKPVFFLAMDTPRTSNCSPKPLYSWMQAAAPRMTTAHGGCTGQYPSLVDHSRSLPGAMATQGSCHPLQSPQHMLKPTKAERTECGWESLRVEIHCQFTRRY